MIQCVRCREEKEEEEFHKAPRNANGRSSYCISCHRAKGRERYVKRKRDNPNFLRERHLRTNYGMTVRDYEKLSASQGGACAICRIKQSEVSRRFNIDHDHSCCPGEKSCGKCIRGLLCWGCNTSIGKMNDDPARLRSAADYLEGRE